MKLFSSHENNPLTHILQGCTFENHPSRMDNLYRINRAVKTNILKNLHDKNIYFFCVHSSTGLMLKRNALVGKVVCFAGGLYPFLEGHGKKLLFPRWLPRDSTASWLNEIPRIRFSDTRSTSDLNQDNGQTAKKSKKNWSIGKGVQVYFQIFRKTPNEHHENENTVTRAGIQRWLFFHVFE